MEGQGYSEFSYHDTNNVSTQICPQGGQLQPPGCDECPDAEERIQGGGGPAAEDTAQHPSQR